MSKKCTKCKIVKTLSNFQVRADNSKYRNECKECMAIFKKEFKLKNKKHIKTKNKTWYEANKQHVLNMVKHYSSKNKDKILENKKVYYKNNEEKAFAKALYKKFNLTIHQYNDMLVAQNGVCAICSKQETCLNNKKTKICRLAVDHCHQTGKVRKLLCANCNKALGLLKENVFVLQSMINYLKVQNE